jgi:hypothetical protein
MAPERTPKKRFHYERSRNMYENKEKGDNFTWKKGGIYTKLNDILYKGTRFLQKPAVVLSLLERSGPNPALQSAEFRRPEHALHGIPRGEYENRGRQAVPLHIAQFDYKVGAGLVRAFPSAWPTSGRPRGVPLRSPVQRQWVWRGVPLRRKALCYVFSCGLSLFRDPPKTVSATGRKES